MSDQKQKPIQFDSKERVAFELMEKIVNRIELNLNTKESWLAFYRECWWVVQGYDPKDNK